MCSVLRTWSWWNTIWILPTEIELLITSNTSRLLPSLPFAIMSLLPLPLSLPLLPLKVTPLTFSLLLYCNQHMKLKPKERDMPGVVSLGLMTGGALWVGGIALQC